MAVLYRPGSYTRAILDALANEYQFDLNTPYEDLPETIQDMLINGINGKSVKVHYKGQRGEGIYDAAFEGPIRNVQRRYRNRFRNHYAGIRNAYANYTV